MNSLAVTFLTLFSIFLSPDIDCITTVQENEPNRVVNLSSNELINGYDIEVENRFDFICISSNGQQVTNKFYIENSKSSKGVKITLKEIYYEDRDIFTYGVDLLFYHSSFFLVEKAKRKIVRINYMGSVTPCDSVYKIIYKSEKENFNLLTDEDVSEVELFNELSRGKVKEYIQGLNIIEKNNLQECESLIKILDEERDDQQFGFETKKYRIRGPMREFLDFLSILIQTELRQVQKEYSSFEIKIVGYADERSFGAETVINYDDFGYPVNENWKIFHDDDNCLRSDLNFYSINNSYSDKEVLKSIDSNCSLGTTRAFAALLYLKRKISSSNLTDLIEFKYSSGGESVGENYSSHRKIRVFLSLKGIGRN